MIVGVTDRATDILSNNETVAMPVNNSVIERDSDADPDSDNDLDNDTG